MERRDFVQLFPDEISLEVFSWVPGLELSRAACVSMDWERLISDSLLWKRLINRDFPKELERLSAIDPIIRQFGHSNYRMIYKALSIGYRSRFTELAGEDCVYGIKRGGSLMCWRSDARRFRQAYVQRSEAEIFGTRIVSLSVRNNHQMLITEDGGCWSWGTNRHGCLGLGGFVVQVEAPKRIDKSYFGNESVIAVSCGGGNFLWHSLAMTKSRNVYSWGYGGSGSLGTGSTLDQFRPSLIPLSKFGLSEVSNDRIAGICGRGASNCLAWTEGGKLFSWGYGHDGQQGHGEKNTEYLPKVVSFPNTADCSVVFATCGLAHCAAILEDGRMFTWGRGWSGQLGRPLENSGIPGVVSVLDEERVETCSLGNAHSACISRAGRLWTWGCSTEGRLGRPCAKESENQPKVVEALCHARLMSVSLGGILGCAIDDCGVLYLFGEQAVETDEAEVGDDAALFWKDGVVSFACPWPIMGERFESDYIVT